MIASMSATPVATPAMIVIFLAESKNEPDEPDPELEEVVMPSVGERLLFVEEGWSIEEVGVPRTSGAGLGVYTKLWIFIQPIPE